jgi:hypothetical protein
MSSQAPRNPASGVDADDGRVWRECGCARAHAARRPRPRGRARADRWGSCAPTRTGFVGRQERIERIGGAGRRVGPRVIGAGERWLSAIDVASITPAMRMIFGVSRPGSSARRPARCGRTRCARALRSPPNLRWCPAEGLRWQAKPSHRRVRAFHGRDRECARPAPHAAAKSAAGRFRSAVFALLIDAHLQSG